MSYRFVERIEARLAFYLSHPLDLTSSDAESYPEKVRFLTAVAKYYNVLTIADFGGKLGTEREPGLVEQVVAAAFQTFDRVEIHPDPFDKAAMLFRGIVQGHPFSDANKRTGFLLVNYYLSSVGFALPADYLADDVIDLCLRVSSGDLRDIAAITEELRRVWAAQSG